MSVIFSPSEVNLMAQWAEAYVQRGGIDLQTSHNTTQLVGKLQGSLALENQPPAEEKPSARERSEKKPREKKPSEKDTK